MKENKFYIYSHTDKDGIVRYIGKGYRQYKPFSRAHFFRKRSDEWKAIFGEVNPIVSILQQDLSEEEVNRAEHYWINHYKLIKDGGTLVNIVNNLSFLTRKEKQQYWKDKDPHWHERKYKIFKAWKEANKEYCRLKDKEYWSKPENRLRKLERAKKNYRKNIQKRKEASKNNYYKLRDTPGFREKMRKKRRALRQSNPELMKKRAKAFYEARKVDPAWIEKRKYFFYRWKENNRAKYNQTNKDWYDKNKERLNARRRELRKLKTMKNEQKMAA